MRYQICKKACSNICKNPTKQISLRELNHRDQKKLIEINRCLFGNRKNRMEKEEWKNQMLEIKKQLYQHKQETIFIKEKSQNLYFQVFNKVQNNLIAKQKDIEAIVRDDQYQLYEIFRDQTQNKQKGQKMYQIIETIKDNYKNITRYKHKNQPQFIILAIKAQLQYFNIHLLKVRIRKALCMENEFNQFRNQINLENKVITYYTKIRQKILSRQIDEGEFKKLILNYNQINIQKNTNRIQKKFVYIQNTQQSLNETKIMRQISKDFKHKLKNKKLNCKNYQNNYQSQKKTVQLSDNFENIQINQPKKQIKNSLNKLIKFNKIMLFQQITQNIIYKTVFCSEKILLKYFKINKLKIQAQIDKQNNYLLKMKILQDLTKIRSELKTKVSSIQVISYIQEMGDAILCCSNILIQFYYQIF